MKTAMQDLIKWGDEMLLKHPQKILGFGEVIDKAEELLEKEKEQIIKAYDNGINIGLEAFEHTFDYLEAEQYYNQTYKL